jgi:hypothetical protein
VCREKERNANGEVCAEEKGKKLDRGGVVLKMIMNSTMLIKSYDAILRCQVTDIIMTFYDPVPIFFNPQTKPIYFT